MQSLLLLLTLFKLGVLGMMIKLVHSGSIPNLQSLLLSINIELGLALLLELHLKLNFDDAVRNSFMVCCWGILSLGSWGRYSGCLWPFAIAYRRLPCLSSMLMQVKPVLLFLAVEAAASISDSKWRGLSCYHHSCFKQTLVWLLRGLGVIQLPFLAT